MRPKSTWVIKGIPSYADSGMIVKTLAQSNCSWPGWVIRPRRPLTSNRGRVNTWMVDAMVEPPSTVITLNGFLINIEEYVETPTAGKKAWMNIKPKILHEIIPGQIYEGEATDKEEDDKSEGKNLDPTQQAERPKKKVKDIDMQPADDEETRVTKRRLESDEQSTRKAERHAEQETSTSAASGNETLINKLLEKLAEKDDQIAKMMAKIDSLQTKLVELSDALLKKHNEESLTATTDSNSDL